MIDREKMTDSELKQQEKLLNCPFCGSKPFIELGKTFSCQLYGEPMQAITIRCKKHECHAKPKVVGGDIYNGGEALAKKDAAKKWNTRAKNPNHQLLVDALEAITLTGDKVSMIKTARNALKAARGG